MITSTALALRDRGARVTSARAREALCRGVGVLLCISVAQAADLSVVGGPWSRSFGQAQLQAGAGTDFPAHLASDELVAMVSISNAEGASWSLHISRVGNEAQWPSDVSVSVKRSGGSGQAGISGGLGYQTLTSEPQLFFSGNGNYENIEILLRLEGVTVQAPPGFYSLAIQYEFQVL